MYALRFQPNEWFNFTIPANVNGLTGPEAFPPQPFLELLAVSDAPWGMEERVPGGPR
jgi:hypothetical protein